MGKLDVVSSSKPLSTHTRFLHCTHHFLWLNFTVDNFLHLHGYSKLSCSYFVLHARCTPFSLPVIFAYFKRHCDCLAQPRCYWLLSPRAQITPGVLEEPTGWRRASQERWASLTEEAIVWKCFQLKTLACGLNMHGITANYELQATKGL